MKLITSMLSLFIILASSCNKNDAIMSESFSCRIDGKKFSPYVSDWKAQDVRCEIHDDFRTLHINARNTASAESVSIIFFPESGKLQPGIKYPLNSNTKFTGIYSMQRSVQFLTDARNIGKFEIIEIDTNAKMLKGKFSFDCYNNELQRSVKVSDGSFNIRYSAYKD